MIKKVHHIGIVVKDLDATIKIYNKILGKKPDSLAGNDEIGIKFANYRLGDVMLEFLEGSAKSNIPAYIKAHGEGIQHLSFETDDIDGELEKLSAAGVKLQDKKPNVLPDLKYAFVGPEGSQGVMIEVVQPVKKGK
jgi:methylmalonyl-CoA/ethylmalonyl-CoA epimerase